MLPNVLYIQNIIGNSAATILLKQHFAYYKKYYILEWFPNAMLTFLNENNFSFGKNLVCQCNIQFYVTAYEFILTNNLTSCQLFLTDN